MKFEIPADCEVDKIETQDGHIVVTFKEKERKLPKNWDEFCEMYPLPLGFATVKTDFDPYQGYLVPYHNRLVDKMSEFTTDRATAEAVLALCQLIQLRNCYNGDWVPDWTDKDKEMFVIEFYKHEPRTSFRRNIPDILYFKTEELCDEFLCYFHDLIEKIKPLYGILEKVKERGEE